MSNIVLLKTGKPTITPEEFRARFPETLADFMRWQTTLTEDEAVQDIVDGINEGSFTIEQAEFNEQAIISGQRPKTETPVFTPEYKKKLYDTAFNELLDTILATVSGPTKDNK